MHPSMGRRHAQARGRALLRLCHSLHPCHGARGSTSRDGQGRISKPLPSSTRRNSRLNSRRAGSAGQAGPLRRCAIPRSSPSAVERHSNLKEESEAMRKFRTQIHAASCWRQRAPLRSRKRRQAPPSRLPSTTTTGPSQMSILGYMSKRAASANSCIVASRCRAHLAGRQDAFPRLRRAHRRPRHEILTVADLVRAQGINHRTSPLPASSVAHHCRDYIARQSFRRRHRHDEMLSDAPLRRRVHLR